MFSIFNRNNYYIIILRLLIYETTMNIKSLNIIFVVFYAKRTFYKEITNSEENLKFSLL